MFKTLFKIILFVFSLLIFHSEAKSDFKVVFVNPGHSSENTTGSFWPNVSRFMEVAAIDFNIELITLYTQRNHIVMTNLAEQILANKPDYVVLVNEKGAALTLIKQISAENIPIFMLLNDISHEQHTQLSTEQKSLITGSLVPNNFIVGKHLIDDLASRYELHAQEMSGNGPKNVLALQGDYNTPASLAREKGLTEGLLSHQNLQHIDSTVAHWSKREAYQKVKGILQRTRIDIIWAANDAMAFGAKQAVLESKVAYPIMIGGINWDIDDSHYPVDVSYGGHVTLGAKALIMLADINENKLPISQRHQVINIFESSLSPFYKSFSHRLVNKQFDCYDFSRFKYSENKVLEYTIENLEKTSLKSDLCSQ